MAFVDLSTVNRCSLPKESFRNANQTCGLARSTLSCGSLVYLINYLDIFFCVFKLPTISIYGLISAFLLLVYLSLTFMLTKYFFVPNLATLIEFAPMTMFGSSFLMFGPTFFVSYYNSFWEICNPRNPESICLSPLQFAKMMGDILRYILIGVMVICMQGYRVDGVTFWSCMSFILTGMVYLYIVIRKSYNVHLIVADLHSIKFRVTVFLYTFLMVLLVIFVVSYANFQRSKVKSKQTQENYLEMDSGDEILGKYQKQRAFSRREIWLKAVNGYRNMADSNVIYRIAMIPSYCVLANFIPVISNDRALIGWNKYTSCLGLLILPIICLPHGFKAVSWLIVCLTCWTLSILTFISTHSLRRPDNIWIFALLGLIVSSVFINLLSREIENIIYQYISMQFDVMPDVTALIYFGLGEMLSESIVVRCLQQRKMWDATFGVVMSLVTYAIFLAFPLLFYQGCYNNKCSDQRLRQLMCERGTTNRCRLRWESGNTQMPLTSWWRDNFSHFGRWASIHRTPQFSSIRPRMPLECHKHQAGVGSRHHHYHRERHPVGRRSTGRASSLCYYQQHQPLSKFGAFIWLLNQRPKRFCRQCFPLGTHSIPHQFQCPHWATSSGSFLSKSRRSPTSTCVAAAIYNNYHQMNKQTFVPLLSWTSDKGESRAKSSADPTSSAFL